MRARTINGTEVPIEAKPQYIWSLPSPSLKTISIGARVHHSGGLQSAYKNRRKVPDLFLPIITQGFNPGIPGIPGGPRTPRSEEHTSELQSRPHLVCRLLLEKKKDRAEAVV